MRYSILCVLVFALVGCVAGTSPSGIPRIGTKDYYDWDAFAAGDRKILLIAFTRFSSHQVGVFPVASFEGSSLPASLELALDADKAFIGRTAVMEEAYVTFKDGERLDLIRQSSPRKTQFTAQKRDGLSYSRAVFYLHDCIKKRKDYTVYTRGYIQGARGRISYREKAGVIYNSNFTILPIWTVMQAD